MLTFMKEHNDGKIQMDQEKEDIRMDTCRKTKRDGQDVPGNTTQ